jgi:hypothetical protein
VKHSMLFRTLAAALIVAGFAFGVLYCREVGPYWKLTPDSTSYVLGAESLAAGHGYRESGYPVVLFAPGTSAILAPAWIAGRSYLALNAEVILFAFAGLGVVFLLFRESLGTAGSGVVVLLCLGSAEYFEQSTFLLSETFYIFFSLLAFWCYRRGSKTGTVVSSLAGLMVRTVGVCLPVAFVLDTLLVDPFHKGRKRWINAASYASPLLFSMVWELRNRRLGWSYTELMMEKDAWNRSSGHIPAAQLLVRLWHNLAYGRAIEEVLTNRWTKDASWAVLPGIVVGFLIAIGFWRLSVNRESAAGNTVRGHSAIGIYCVLFSLTVALYWPEVVVRLMMPLAPFLMAYVVAGVQAIAERSWGRWMYAPAGFCLALYLAAGYRNDLQVVSDDRAARIPGQFVIYPGNEDMQRLAAWWKEHAGENERYACQHPNVINIITGRDGVGYEDAGESGRIRRSMEERHVRYLLLAMNSDADRAAAQSIEQDGHFRLAREQGIARLYELAGP